MKTLIQNRLLFENEYEAANGNLLKTTYGNGDWWSFTYDNLDRVTAKDSENGQAAEYAYNGQDQLVRLTDYLSGNTTEYTYDLLGRLTGSRTNGVNDVRAEYSYDKYNRWTGQTNITSGGSHAYGVDYGQDNLVSWSNQGRFSFNYDYDNLNRVTSEYLYVDGLYTRRYTQYTYTPGLFGSTSGLVSGMYFHSYDNEESLAYTYDDAGNISTIKENGVLKATYTYDQFGQLVREDNAWANKTYIYSYDAGGNLTMCREAPYTTGSITEYTGGATYTYATGTETDGSPVWKDLLTSYNGTAIKYDAIGNPLNWNGISNLAWSNGQRLTALRKGAMTVSYAYDETGLRTKKQVDLKTSLYDRDASGNLVHETRNNGQDHLYYYYDADGSIRSISYNGTRYAFRKNLQGDVIAILDTNGEVVARYTYDAWGKVLMVTDGNGNINTSSTFIGNINPIRYRGYYYDTETGWYYLNSRYYDPQVRRFINADGIIGANGVFTGYNLFAYCNNSPVRFNDPSGTYINDTSHVSHRNPGGGYGIPGGLKYEVGFNYLDYAIRPAPLYTNVGVSYSVNQTDDVSKELLPDDPIMYATQGVKTQTTVASIGDSSKPVSFYATHDINDPSTLVSSVGIKLNFNDLTISANLGKTNIGIRGSLKNGDTSKSLSAKFNISKMRAGVEGATTQWDGNMSVTEYRELGVNTTGVVVAVAFIAKVLGPKTAIA